MFNCKVFPIDTVLKPVHGQILSGNDILIGNNEKRRNKEVLHVELPYNLNNYALFYKSTQERLAKAVNALVYLLNNPDISERKKAGFYRVLIESLHIVHHISTGSRKSKLNGINSLSTCCLDNCFCLDRMKDNDSICLHCYAGTQQKQQLALQDNNTINGVILRNIVIPAKYWKKYINPADITKYFRFESFGDIANKTQALNYIEFCRAFPKVHFAVWTKNTGIWFFAFQQAGKPANLSYIVSSNKVNYCEDWRLNSDININHIFTVYDKKHIQEYDTKINCGGRACLECIKKHKACYFTDTETIINEQLK